MPEPSAYKKLVPNPFYLALLIASTAFVATIFAYLVGPALADLGSGPATFTPWIDRNAPTALGVEIAAMLVAGGLAMLTDRPAKSRKGTPPADPS